MTRHHDGCRGGGSGRHRGLPASVEPAELAIVCWLLVANKENIRLLICFLAEVLKVVSIVAG